MRLIFLIRIEHLFKSFINIFASFCTPYFEFFYMYVLFLYGYFLNFCYFCTVLGDGIVNFSLFELNLPVVIH